MPQPSAADRAHAKLVPGSKEKLYKRPLQTLVRSSGHHREWLDACKGDHAAGSTFAYGTALTEVGLSSGSS